jgi:hypothetical protein
VVIKKLKGSSQKVRRAHILLKSDADGRHGPIRKSPRHLTVAYRRLRICVSAW